MKDPGLFETMFSLRAMRRLKSDPIPQEVLDQLLAAGTQAPSGMNSQPWAFLAIQDPATKKFIQDTPTNQTIPIFPCSTNHTPPILMRPPPRPP